MNKYFVIIRAWSLIATNSTNQFNIYLLSDFYRIIQKNKIKEIAMKQILYMYVLYI